MTVLIEDGKVKALLREGEGFIARESLDVRGMLVIPGAIDIHVHCREPSLESRGDFATESRAAAAGGITTFFEMPISNPCAATPEVLRMRRELAAKKAYVNIGLYAAPGLRKAREIERMAEEGAIGFKLFTTRAVKGREDEFMGLTTESIAEIVEALELIKPTGLRCVFHAEDQSLLDLYTARARQRDVPDYRRHELSRPELVEAVAVSKLLTVAKKLQTPIHIAHVTSAEAVELIRRAKDDGVLVSAETCPHYLCFTDDILEKVGPYGKINPPIRYERDRQALWAGIADGTIDLVATDHAPFTKQEKEASWGDIISAPPGHPGLEVLVPLMLSCALRGDMDVAKAVTLISATPARLFDLYPRKGALLPGSDADVTVYDPRRKTTMRRGSGFSRAADCDVLYDGMELLGSVYLTIVAGKIVYRDGEVTGQQGDGRIVSPKGRAFAGSPDARS